jgi:NitT/TauT family transport system substrate-binding protein
MKFSLPPKLLTAICGGLLMTSSFARAQLTPVEIAYFPSVGLASLFVMEAEGWARDEGIDLKLTRFSSGAAIIQALASGKYDGSYMAPTPTAVARVAGLNLKVVALSGVELTTFIGTAELGSAFSKASSPADGFARFVSEHGRPVKIATLPKGTAPDMLIRHYLEKNEVPSKNYEIVGQGEEQVRQSFLAKVVDGASMPEPMISIVMSTIPTTKVVASGKDLLAQHPGFFLAMRETFIKEHPEVVLKLVKLNSRGVALVMSDPKRAAADVLKHFGQGLMDPDVVATALNSPFNPNSSDLLGALPGWRAMQDYQVKLGIQARKLPDDEFFDLSFYKSLQTASR